MKLSMIVPAYNDEGTLEAAVAEALNELPKLYESCEVIIVNDDSRDQTARVADQLAAAHPTQVKVIHLQNHLGYEAALKAGVQAASGEKVLFTRPAH